MKFNVYTVDFQLSTPARRVVAWGLLPLGLLLGLATAAGAYDSSWIVAGQPVSASKLKQALDDTNTQLSATATARALRVVKSGDQVLGGGGATVTFDTVKVGGLSGWNYDTFVTPSAGVYRVTAKFALPAAPGTGTRYLNLVVNGTLYAQMNSQPAMETATQVYVTDIIKLGQGDVVTLQAGSDGGTFKVAGLPDGRASTLTIERLGN